MEIGEPLFPLFIEGSELISLPGAQLGPKQQQEPLSPLAPTASRHKVLLPGPVLRSTNHESLMLQKNLHIFTSLLQEQSFEEKLRPAPMVSTLLANASCAEQLHHKPFA